MDVRSTREALEWYKGIEDDISLQITRLESMNARIYSIGSPTISDMPKGGSPIHDRSAELIARKVDVEEKIRQMECDQALVREWLNDGISRIRNPYEKAAVQARYLDGMEWKAVTDILFGGEDDYDDRVDSYTRRTYLIHGSALQTLSGILQPEPKIMRIINPYTEKR